MYLIINSTYFPRKNIYKQIRMSSNGLGNEKAVHWWIDQLTALHKQCIVTKRKLQQAESRSGLIERDTE